MDYRKEAKDFILPDVTEMLFAMMQEGEAEGRKLAEDYQGIKGFVGKNLKFMKKVGKGKDFDLKSKEEWSSSWYYFDGYVLRFDDPGNIVYGIILMEAFHKSFLKIDFVTEGYGHFGAGMAQLLDNVFNPLLSADYTNMNLDASLDSYYDQYGQLPDRRVLDRLINALKTYSFKETWYDDPRDYAAIELGYEYYKNGRYR